MKIQRFVAKALALAMVLSTTPAALLAQQSTTLSGTAKDEAKKPFSDYTARARDVNTLAIGASVPLDPQGNFSLAGLGTARYSVELLNKEGKVVCTEGPFDLSKQAIKSDVVVDCHGLPAAFWLVGAAAAAGITAAAIAAGPASPSR